MNAAQGLDFRAPLKSSPFLQNIKDEYRKEVPFVEDDVVMADYIHDTMTFLEKFEINIPE